jgi:hypothetical protein
LTGWTHRPSAHAFELALAVLTLEIFGGQRLDIAYIRPAPNGTHLVFTSSCFPLHLWIFKNGGNHKPFFSIRS